MPTKFKHLFFIHWGLSLFDAVKYLPIKNCKQKELFFGGFHRRRQRSSDEAHESCEYIMAKAVSVATVCHSLQMEEAAGWGLQHVMFRHSRRAKHFKKCELKQSFHESFSSCLTKFKYE